MFVLSKGNNANVRHIHVCRCATMQMCECDNVHVCQCANVPMWYCANVHMCKWVAYREKEAMETCAREVAKRRSGKRPPGSEIHFRIREH